MGRIANALAGTIGTAVVTTNCFFAGSNDDIIASHEIANENNLSNGNESVVYIGSAPSEGIDLRDYLSDTSDVIGQAFEDAEKHDNRQEANNMILDMENNEQTSGSAPPNNYDNLALDSGKTAGADLSANNTSGSVTVDYNNDMNDFGSLNDSDGYIDSSELSDDEENSEDDGMSM